MSHTLLVALISPLLSGLLIYFFEKLSKNKPVIKIDGSKELKPSKLFYYLGIIIIGFGTYIFSYILYKDEADALIVGLVFYIMVGGLGLPFYLHYQTYRVIINKNYIRVTNMLGETKQLNWTDVDYAYQNPLTYYYILKSKKQKLRVDPYLIGIDYFHEFVYRKTNFNLKN